MKKSVSRKISRRLIIVLFCIMLVFEIITYFLISDIFHKEYDQLFMTIDSIYHDLIEYDLKMNERTLDNDFADVAIKFGDYLVEWYKCDNCSVYSKYIVEDEDGKLHDDYIQYVAYCSKDKLGDTSYENHLVGKIEEHGIYYREDMVYGEYEVFGIIQENNKVRTIILLSDGINNYLVEIQYSYTIILSNIINRFIIVSIVILLSLVGIYFLARMLINKFVKDPAEKICNSMQEFIDNGNHLDTKLELKGEDEFTLIAEEFNKLTISIEEYINSINDLSNEKSKQQAELYVASRIQQGFLNHNQLKGDNFVIRGIMKPAKLVGGDLYDYFMIDNNKVLITVADISDKGIIAAMYMVITLTLIRQFAKLGLKPNEILEYTNNTLCEKNALSQFSTVFLAIYDKSTNVITYSNAGHNYPYIIGDELIKLDKAKGTLIGLFENEKFENATVELKSGETLFMYTDGVTEATNKDNKFFTEEKLEEILIGNKESYKHDLIEYVNAKVDEFVGDSLQHDDITMLTLSLNKHIKLELNVEIFEMAKIKECILSLNLPKENTLKICLIIEEYFVNICSYAFPNGIKEDDKVILDITISDDIVIKLIDGGIEYNPLDNEFNLEEHDIEESIGGFGQFIASSLADDVSYKYENKKNILIITIK